MEENQTSTEILPPKNRSFSLSYVKFVSPRKQIGFWVIYATAVCVLFAKPLYSLFVHAVENELQSHILLIPFISAYLMMTRNREFGLKLNCAPGRAAAAFVIGTGSLMACFEFKRRHYLINVTDELALTVFGFLWLQMVGGFQFLGRAWMAANAFPVGFLFFMVPLPDVLVDSLETASKLASAEVAALFFSLSGTPVVRDGLLFQLPGIIIQVAQECSGIRSSLVLLITSCVASYIFLCSPVRRLAFVLLAIPLGVLRNGFRILVIGLLCTYQGPQMIHHAIHRRGGPVFFALSLVPFFMLLLWLRRTEVLAQRRVKCK